MPQSPPGAGEYATAARAAVTADLNASCGNPLVPVPRPAAAGNGDFHPIGLAVACHALRIAFVQVGQLSERRMSHLRDAFFR